MLRITSFSNPKIKDAIGLREHRHRKESGLFLIEGFRELQRALDANWELEALFYSPDWFLGTGERGLIERVQAPQYECSKEVFQKLSYRDRPDGLLAIGKQRIRRLEECKLSAMPFLLIAESIEKPGNLGTILRSADAAGVEAVILCDPTTDLYNPNVVRASVGTLFALPIFIATSTEAISFLQDRGIRIVAATPKGEKLFTEENFCLPVAVAMGTEQYGLSQFWMEHADIQVRIPMLGIADSLNVSSATTLLLYEVVRQRSLDLLHN
ncbi:MAG: RNA methyltransferase [Verrucomicrobiota bacterium]|nr:RNA methyltransferase [Verrucomicrobiota bacterium]